MQRSFMSDIPPIECSYRGPRAVRIQMRYDFHSCRTHPNPSQEGLSIDLLRLRAYLTRSSIVLLNLCDRDLLIRISLDLNAGSNFEMTSRSGNATFRALRYSWRLSLTRIAIARHQNARSNHRKSRKLQSRRIFSVQQKRVKRAENG